MKDPLKRAIQQNDTKWKKLFVGNLRYNMTVQS
jgi:hypothetical protein